MDEPTGNWPEPSGDGTNEPEIPLLPAEREVALGNISDLDVFEVLLSARGVLGLVVDCDECATEHYLEWELLRANLRHVLDTGRMVVHEPAFDPDPERYVSWDYARGFADGVLEAASGGESADD